MYLKFTSPRLVITQRSHLCCLKNKLIKQACINNSDTGWWFFSPDPKAKLGTGWLDGAREEEASSLRAKANLATNYASFSNAGDNGDQVLTTTNSFGSCRQKIYCHQWQGTNFYIIFFNNQYTNTIDWRIELDCYISWCHRCIIYNCWTIANDGVKWF